MASAQFDDPADGLRRLDGKVSVPGEALSRRWQIRAIAGVGVIVTAALLIIMQCYINVPSTSDIHKLFQVLLRLTRYPLVFLGLLAAGAFCFSFFMTAEPPAEEDGSMTSDRPSI